MSTTMKRCIIGLVLGALTAFAAPPADGGGMIIEIGEERLEAPVARVRESGLCQVAVTIFAVKISPGLASDWGLDGGPAAKPESTPLKGDIPRCMSKEQARTLITALRNHKETTIIGSLSLTIQTGQEGYGASTKEMMFPETFEEPEFEATDDDEGDEGDEDQDEDDEVDDVEDAPMESRPPRKKSRRTVPAGKFNLAQFSPVFGAPRTDIGLNFTVTPQVGDDLKTITVDVHPKWVVDKWVDTIVPMFSAIEFRTSVNLRSGETMILMSGTPALNGDYYSYKPDEATDRRPYVVFMSAEIVNAAEEK